jgi:hypothetical protein
MDPASTSSLPIQDRRDPGRVPLDPGRVPLDPGRVALDPGRVALGPKRRAVESREPLTAFTSSADGPLLLARYLSEVA